MHISKAQIKLIRALQQKKQREENRLFVAEGEKCIIELQKRYPLHLLVAEEGYAWRWNRQEALEASSMEISQMSGLRTPQGLIGIFLLPEDAPLPVFTKELMSAEDLLVLALDGVQDPGNMGTIIRTADWFGIRHIVCSRDTADCYNPKVVQATMGALARINIHYTDLREWLEQQALIAPVYGTLLEGKNMYREGAIIDKHHGIIVMGNEGNGISESVRKIVTHPLRIPSYPEGEDTSESLNVAIATAVVISHFRQP